MKWQGMNERTDENECGQKESKMYAKYDGMMMVNEN